MIVHEIDQISYTLRADGALTMYDTQGVQIDLSPEAVWGLMWFLQLPGIRPLINRAGLERQRKNGEEEQL